jgi:large subunit ribosomal protein L35
MPRTGTKLKTHRGTFKRFRTTGSGKLARKRSGNQHLLTHKGAKRKRGYANPAELTPADRDAIKRLLPNGTR